MLLELGVKSNQPFLIMLHFTVLKKISLNIYSKYNKNSWENIFYFVIILEWTKNEFTCSGWWYCVIQHAIGANQSKFLLVNANKIWFEYFVRSFFFKKKKKHNHQSNSISIINCWIYSKRKRDSLKSDHQKLKSTKKKKKTVLKNYVRLPCELVSTKFMWFEMLWKSYFDAIIVGCRCCLVKKNMNEMHH